MEHQFEIKIIDLHWLDFKDEPGDLCAHGRVLLRIGSKILSDENRDSWTVSATGLYLLRSLYKDHSIGEYTSQFLPHCGFTKMKDPVRGLIIFGCGIGIDWDIRHSESFVEHIKEEAVGRIEFDDYKKMVFEFTDSVEQFYNGSKPKEPQEDDKEGELLFWSEWKTLRNK